LALQYSSADIETVARMLQWTTICYITVNADLNTFAFIVKLLYTLSSFESSSSSSFI